MSKKGKWLHEFVINKQDKTMESHTETNDKGEKGSLILEYKSYFENTFVTQYQELG